MFWYVFLKRVKTEKSKETQTAAIREPQQDFSISDLSSLFKKKFFGSKISKFRWSANDMLQIFSHNAPEKFPHLKFIADPLEEVHVHRGLFKIECFVSSKVWIIITIFWIGSKNFWLFANQKEFFAYGLVFRIWKRSKHPQTPLISWIFSVFIATNSVIHRDISVCCFLLCDERHRRRAIIIMMYHVLQFPHVPNFIFTVNAVSGDGQSIIFLRFCRFIFFFLFRHKQLNKAWSDDASKQY